LFLRLSRPPSLRLDRVNPRNGYRRREWDTRAGTIELAIPKLRQGSYHPEWLLERRRRAERALATVVATSYLLGVSTRRVEKLADAPGGEVAVHGLPRAGTATHSRSGPVHIQDGLDNPPQRPDPGPSPPPGPLCATLVISRAATVTSAHVDAHGYVVPTRRRMAAIIRGGNTSGGTIVRCRPGEGATL
jgi:hypothetical protein